MAYGLHWEWRGFGPLDPAVRERIEALSTAQPGVREETDSYLWTPQCTANVKFRTFGEGSLKYKRLVRVNGPVQLWLEDPREDYRFPVPPEAVRELAAVLGVVLPLADGPVERATLQQWLQQAEGVRIVEVKKRRTVHTWRSNGKQASIELADILAPQSLQSVGIEGTDETDEAANAVVGARDALEVSDTLVALSYLDILRRWTG
ncbi:hypothetical protein [Gloeobacter morelensis]|uniref:CYTH domain-containing protein n=1 Tax=Gloeobacter morelensis MG652769 TaxID=2781736 RepID=A0ABY3PQD1_9CYAN|nr:hypothetical protein [Gloeobacter morelensis]UFP95830.1 hypothetical protein ISF26_06245 [Gloeobacter morelensis MG652769]